MNIRFVKVTGAADGNMLVHWS